MTSSPTLHKEKYSPNKLPLLWMMLTGGLAGSIAEVTRVLFRSPQFHSTRPRSGCNFKDKKGRQSSTKVCSTASEPSSLKKVLPLSSKG